VSDSNLAGAIDDQIATTFGRTGIFLPLRRNDASVSNGEDHVRENHRAVRELIAVGNRVCFQGNIHPIEIATSVGDGEGRCLAVRETRRDDPVRTAGSDRTIDGVTGTEALDGVALLLLASRATIPASEAPPVEAVAPGEDRLKDRYGGVDVILGADEVEEDLASILRWIRRDQVVPCEFYNFVRRGRIVADVVEPPVEGLSDLIGVGSVTSAFHVVGVVIDTFLVLWQLLLLSGRMMDEHSVFYFFYV